MKVVFQFLIILFHFLPIKPWNTQNASRMDNMVVGFCLPQLWTLRIHGIQWSSSGMKPQWLFWGRCSQRDQAIGSRNPTTGRMRLCPHFRIWARITMNHQSLMIWWRTAPKRWTSARIAEEPSLLPRLIGGDTGMAPWETMRWKADSASSTSMAMAHTPSPCLNAKLQHAE